MVGQELTDLLVDDLDLNLEEAEQVKCETGLTGERDAAAEALQAGIRPLLAEIRSSINYFRAGSDGAQLEGISLTGGGSALPGLAAALSRPERRADRRCHPDAAHRQPARRAIEPEAREFDPAASAVSIGLAHGSGGMTVTVEQPALWRAARLGNRRGPDPTGAHQRPPAQGSSQADGGSESARCWSSCAGGYYLAARENASATSALASVQDRTAQLQGVGRGYADVVSIQGSVRQVRAQIAQLMSGDVDLAALMGELRSNLPATMTITEETITDQHGRRGRRRQRRSRRRSGHVRAAADRHHHHQRHRADAR